jgi:hypothetical protein
MKLVGQLNLRSCHAVNATSVGSAVNIPSVGGKPIKGWQVEATRRGLAKREFGIERRGRTMRTWQARDFRVLRFDPVDSTATAAIARTGKTARMAAERLTPYSPWCPNQLRGAEPKGRAVRCSRM